ncbi:hypothetical protein [[Acholeplasma] multilocale]|uniref:hypothetical protein n=1 Tax=[Acholeplasma] multilocale TaxID=264638 RepID=UPI00047E4AB0|nr:hypothetical protein [[Acholeplasma] multilocale]
MKKSLKMTMAALGALALSGGVFATTYVVMNQKNENSSLALQAKLLREVNSKLLQQIADLKTKLEGFKEQLAKINTSLEGVKTELLKSVEPISIVLNTTQTGQTWLGANEAPTSSNTLAEIATWVTEASKQLETLATETVEGLDKILVTLGLTEEEAIAIIGTEAKIAKIQELVEAQNEKIAGLEEDKANLLEGFGTSVSKTYTLIETIKTKETTSVIYKEAAAEAFGDIDTAAQIAKIKEIIADSTKDVATIISEVAAINDAGNEAIKNFTTILDTKALALEGEIAELKAYIEAAEKAIGEITTGIVAEIEEEIQNIIDGLGEIKPAQA